MQTTVLTRRKGKAFKPVKMRIGNVMFTLDKAEELEEVRAVLAKGNKVCSELLKVLQ